MEQHITTYTTRNRRLWHNIFANCRIFLEILKWKVINFIFDKPIVIQELVP